MFKGLSRVIVLRCDVSVLLAFEASGHPCFSLVNPHLGDFCFRIESILEPAPALLLSSGSFFNSFAFRLRIFFRSFGHGKLLF